VSPYAIYIHPDARQEIRELPGHMRQRIRRAIDDLGNDPRPGPSKLLTYPSLDLELRRIRLDRWRIVYAIDEAQAFIDVIAVRKRPPYDYGDLSEIIGRALQ